MKKPPRVRLLLSIWFKLTAGHPLAMNGKSQRIWQMMTYGGKTDHSVARLFFFNCDMSTSALAGKVMRRWYLFV